MQIRPNDNFRLLGVGYNPPSLKKGQLYFARHATNQPDWEEMGKVFVPFYHGQDEPSILLERGDYEIVTP